MSDSCTRSGVGIDHNRAGGLSERALVFRISFNEDWQVHKYPLTAPAPKLGSHVRHHLRKVSLFPGQSKGIKAWAVLTRAGGGLKLPSLRLRLPFTFTSKPANLHFCRGRLDAA